MSLKILDATDDGTNVNILVDLNASDATDPHTVDNRLYNISASNFETATALGNVQAGETKAQYFTRILQTVVKPNARAAAVANGFTNKPAPTKIPALIGQDIT
jgi:hypothetical protein